MNQQQTIDWLQARLTSAEDTTLSQTRSMAQMIIELSSRQAEIERLKALIVQRGQPMSKLKHTPGPWQVSGGRSRVDAYGHMVGADGLSIACVFYSDRTNADHIASLADAHLIAQAWKIPDLEVEIEQLTAENERLKMLVIGAYQEGFEDAGPRQPLSLYDNWQRSQTSAALHSETCGTLQPKEDK